MQNKQQFSERLSILTDSERKLLYDLPKFTRQERELYFNLEKIEKAILVNQLKGINSKIYFTLQLGYFKACNRFFKFNLNEVKEDIKYILENYFPIDFRAMKIILTLQAKLNQLSSLMLIQNIFLRRLLDL